MNPMDHIKAYRKQQEIKAEKERKYWANFYKEKNKKKKYLPISN